MRRVLIGVAALMVGAVGGAQAQSGGFKDVPKGHWASESVRAMSSLGVIIPDKSKSGTVAFDGAKPVTRYELALTLWRFVQYLERSDKQKRGKTQALAPKSGADAVRALIAGGYLPKDSVLAKEGGKSVTATQLSDAMVHLIAKTREKKVPITPDSEFAPITRPGNPS